MIENKLVEQKYNFYGKYKDKKGTEQAVSVGLHINHFSKEFKVIPGDGREGFNFLTGSHNHAMWLATVQCMEAAIIFATEVLELKEAEPAS